MGIGPKYTKVKHKKKTSIHFGRTLHLYLTGLWFVAVFLFVQLVVVGVVCLGLCSPSYVIHKTKQVMVTLNGIVPQNQMAFTHKVQNRH